MVTLCIIIGDLHWFIGLCLIPLDPWHILQWIIKTGWLDFNAFINFVNLEFRERKVNLYTENYIVCIYMYMYDGLDKTTNTLKTAFYILYFELTKPANTILQLVTTTKDRCQIFSDQSLK